MIKIINLNSIISVMRKSYFHKLYFFNYSKILNLFRPAPFLSTKERTVAEQLNQHPGPGEYE